MTSEARARRPRHRVSGAGQSPHGQARSAESCARGHITGTRGHTHIRGRCHPIGGMQSAEMAATIGSRSAGRRSRPKEHEMCRWMAWLGQPVLIEELLFKTQHGIVDQSLHSRMGAEPTNGDGFGLGWYGTGEGPGVYHSVAPAWGDANLRELAAHIESPLFIAHVRAAIGSPVQQTNCHPFRHGQLAVRPQRLHRRLPQLRRDLMLAIEPALFADVHGIDGHRGGLPPRAHVRARGGPDRARSSAPSVFIEATARRHGRRRRRCRAPSASRTARTCGRCATRPRASRARCSPRPTRTRSAACIPRTRASQRLGRRRPADRLRAVLRPARRVARDPAGTAVTVRRGGVLEQRPFEPASVASSAAPPDGAAELHVRRPDAGDEVAGLGTSG